MYVTSLRTIVFGVLVCVVASATHGQMLRPASLASEQIVVLSNGEIIHGMVTRNSEQTVVQTEQGSRLVLANDRVDFVCNSLEDAYWGKCARTKASDIQGQKDIFYWCLKHKLHEQAQNQIALMAESDKAKATDLEVLDRQLSVAIEQASKSKTKSELLNRPLAPYPATTPTTQSFNPIARLATQTQQPKANLPLRSVNSFVPIKPNGVQQGLVSQATDRSRYENAKPRTEFLEPIEFEENIGSGKLANNFEPLNPAQPLAFNPDQLDFNSFEPLPKLQPQSQGSLGSVQTLNADGELASQTTTEMPSANSIVFGGNFGKAPSQIRQVGFEEPVVTGTVETSNSEPQFEAIVNPVKGSSRLVVPQRDARTSEQSPKLKPIQPKQGVTNQELDRMTRSMPKGTLGPYRGLEKILTHGCAAAKCHHSDADTMPLWHLAKGKSLTRRMSQRNLHYILQYVDRSDPFSSQLLKAALTAHGDLEQPVLTKGTKQFEQLKLWIVMLSDDPEGNYQRYLNGDSDPVEVEISHPDFKPASPLAMKPDGKFPANSLLPLDAIPNGIQPFNNGVEIPKTIGDIPELKPDKNTFKPVDPFDPEIFNRGFGNR